MKNYEYEYVNVRGYTHCCGVLVEYPFKHAEWCPYHNFDTKKIKARDVPINVKRPYLEDDLIQDFHTGKRYRMKDGEWVEEESE